MPAWHLYNIKDYYISREKDSNINFYPSDNQIKIKASSLNFLLKIRGLESTLGEWVCTAKRYTSKETE